MTEGPRACAIKTLCMVGAAAIALTASTGWAQTAAPSQNAAETPDGSDIIVTAQRRNERLVEVPMSVVAVNADAIERAGVVSVHDINRLAAGVQINFAGCCTQPAIRGISTLTTGIGFENNVAIYVDGFYTPDNLSLNGDLANIQSIEILKGPQGTLWGRNATGGAILINTKAPSDTPTGSFEVGYARYNEVSAQAYVAGPLASGIRASLSAYNRKSDGYIKLLDGAGNRIGDAAPIHQASVRAKVEIDLGEQTTATFGANYGLSSDPRGGIFTVLQYPSALLPKPPARADQPRTSSRTAETVTRAEVNEGTLKLVHNADFGTITSYTGYALRKTYMAYDFDGTSAGILLSRAHWRQKTFQQTLDVNVTAIDGFDFVVGGSYYHDNQSTPDQYGEGIATTLQQFAIRLKTESLAAYVDGTIDLADRLKLNVGARYTHETKSGAYSRFNPITGAALTAPGANSVTFNAFTPRGSLRYEIDTDTNVYASISRGFRSGGFNPNGAVDPTLFLPYDPEKITAYELGFKTAGRTLQFETSAFYYDFKDLQVGVTQTQPPFGLVNKVVNAPKAEVYGIDALVTVQPVVDFNIRLGAAYLHGRYKDFANATGTGLNSATQMNVSNQAQDWTGHEMARTPKLSGNLSVDYTMRDVVGGSLLMSATGNYSSSFVPNNPSLYGPLASPELQNKQRFRQGAYATLNLNVSWTDASDHLKLTAYVNNVTNTSYKLAYNGAFIGDYANWSQPVTWGMRVGYKY